MKRILTVIIIVCIMVSVLVIPANAGEWVRYWRNNRTRTSGVAILDTDSPVEITKTALSFNISEFPICGWEMCGTHIGDTLTQTLDLSGSTVTAEYTFYNPSDSDVTVQVVFPYEIRNYYHTDNGSYNVTVNGESVNKIFRQTLKCSPEFNVEKDILRLSDEYLLFEGFAADTPVTKYTYRYGSSVDELMGHDGNMAFEIVGGSDNTKAYIDGIRAYSAELSDGRDMLYCTNKNGKKGDFDVYVIGDHHSEAPDWQAYSDSTLNTPLDMELDIRLISESSMTFESFVLQYWSHDLPFYKVDWYNAVVSNLSADGGLIESDIGFNVRKRAFLRRLLSWYQYEITLAPGESVVNTVTSPMYPRADVSYNEYTYDFSPASCLTGFGDVQININTPYYLHYSNIEGLEKTDKGYTLDIDGVDAGAFEFHLSTRPKRNNSKRTDTDPRNISLTIGTVVAGAALLVAVPVTVTVVLRKKKKKCEESLTSESGE